MELGTTQEATSYVAYSTVSQHFVEPKGSLPHSQELFICPYPQPD
jgi:hypothetical protein